MDNFEGDYNVILHEDEEKETREPVIVETICQDIGVNDLINFEVNLPSEIERMKHPKCPKKKSVVKKVDEIDESERKDIRKLYANDDEDADAVPVCCLLKCNRLIDKKTALMHRNNFHELSKVEQDIVLLSKIQSLRRISRLDEEYVSRTVRKTFRRPSEPRLKKLNMNYQFAGLTICKKFFFFLNPVGEDRFCNLLKHYEVKGVSPRTHKLAGITPTRNNVLSVDDISSIVTFIKKYADEFALPLPGRMPNCKNTVMKLPSADSKSSVYRKYCESARPVGAREIKRSAFLNIWQKYVPFITVMKPLLTVQNTTPTVKKQTRKK